jgi:hypothetical protein
MLDCVVVVDVFDNVAYMLKNPINRSNMSRVNAYDTVDRRSCCKENRYHVLMQLLSLSLWSCVRCFSSCDRSRDEINR